MYVDEMLLKRSDQNYKATICLCYSSSPADYYKMEECLHWQEYQHYHALKYEKRKKSYLLGRYSAKKAFSYYVNEASLGNIFIQSGVFSQPVAVYEYGRNIQVSIAHCQDFGAAIAFPEAHPMGIDIEMIDRGKVDVLAEQMTNSEKKLIKSHHSHDAMLTFLWTVKEGLSKVLRTGLTAPLYIYEIEKIETECNCIFSYFKNFGQYKAISFALGNYICSIVYPLHTEINLDVSVLQKKFYFGLQEKDCVILHKHTIPVGTCAGNYWY